MTEAITREGCACERRIDPSILEDYACGSPACWRTAAVKASFDSFVIELVAERDPFAAPSREPLQS